ncbi:hypothetical protein BDB01DRAFT_830572 [Pilobolus umbonatus]|nr:hypothetical protein BDB01DRAFT_830572 [Pilobolus umbonatus]
MDRLYTISDSILFEKAFPCMFFCDEEQEPLPGSPVSTSKSPTGFQTQLMAHYLFTQTEDEELPNTFFGWIIPLLKTPNSVILDKVGLDAVVFLLMSFKLFTFCGFFGTVVLYPISRMGGDFKNGTIPDPGNSTSVFYKPDSMFNTHSNSFLWVYLFFTYLFCFATFYFTFLNYRDYVRIRREYLLRKAKTLSARTLLVTGIPSCLRSDRKLADYFEKLGIGVVESVHTIRHVGRLLEFIKERTQYLRQLELAYTNYLGNPCHDPNYDPDMILNEEESGIVAHDVDSIHSDSSLPLHQIQKSRPLIKQGLLCGPKVDAIQYYTAKFEEVDKIVVKARKVGKFIPTSVGFVTFEETISAYIASQVLIDSTPFRLRARLAPEPRDVLWENIAMHGRERMIRKILILFILLFLVFSWGIPCIYLSALTSEKSLRAYFPWLMKLAKENKILNQIVVGFIPTLGVVIFFSILPLVFNSLSVIEGFTTRSESEESCFGKQFFFLFINVLINVTVASALFKSQKDIIEDPTKIANIFASSLPEVAPFYINYSVLQGMMLCPIQLLQIGPIIVQLFYKVFMCKTPRDYGEVLTPRMYNYGWGYPIPVFMFVVILVYSTISPLILVFGVIYFAMSYLVCKYQLLYDIAVVYFHSYDVAGRMWPLVFTRIIIGLLIFELTSTGLFTLNKSYTLAALCVPLVVLTIAYKIVMDAAYQKSTQFLPLHLLSEKLGPMTTAIDHTKDSNERSVPKDEDHRNCEPPTINFEEPLDMTDEPVHPSTPKENGTTIIPDANASSSKAVIRKNRARRTVLDEDDYVADPREYTDFREPPMTLLEGILNTGMKQYGHPALLGVLPQLWLPIKAGDIKDRRFDRFQHDDSEVSSSSSFFSILHDVGRNVREEENQPLLREANIPGRGYNTLRNNRKVDKTAARGAVRRTEGGHTDEEDEADNTGTYYHHPERRQSKNLLSQSYGTQKNL